MSRKKVENEVKGTNWSLYSTVLVLILQRLFWMKTSQHPLLLSEKAEGMLIFFRLA